MEMPKVFKITLKELINIFCIIMIGYFLMWLAEIISEGSMAYIITLPHSNSGIGPFITRNLDNVLFKTRYYNPFRPTDPQNCCSSVSLAALWKTGYLLMFLGYPVSLLIRFSIRIIKEITRKT